MMDKRGFTLIEAVISVGLISFIALAFMTLTIGYFRSDSQIAAYDEKSAALVSALEEGALDADMESLDEGTVSIDMGGGNFVTVQKKELVYSGDSSGVIYYEYR